jgi:hypothetical protein
MLHHILLGLFGQHIVNAIMHLLEQALADPLYWRSGGQGDPALARSGLTRKLRRQEAAIARNPRLLVYELGRRATPLNRSGLLLTGGLEKQTVAPRGCGGFEARCDSLSQTRRISLGLGYGDQTGLVSLTYFNDRLRGFDGRTRYADGAQLTLLKSYDRLF